MDSNYRLVDRLVASGRIKSSRIEEAFRKVDRSEFVPEELSDQAFQDRPLAIGPEATISAPHMVAINTELLQPEKSSRIVEIGSGSGYQAAVLGELAAKVTGVEINKELAEKSAERLERLGYDNVEIVEGDGLEAVEGSFDMILFSCAISQERFDFAVERLEEDGVLVAPVVVDSAQILRKYSDEEVSDHGGVSFVEFQD